METTFTVTNFKDIDKSNKKSQWVLGIIAAFGVGGISVLFYPYALILVPLMLAIIAGIEVKKYIAYTKSIDLTTNKYATTLEDINDTGL